MESFSEWVKNEGLKKEVQNLCNGLELENPGLILSVSVEPSGALEINKITVQNRGSGTGTKAMRELCDFADKRGLITVLSPSSDFGGSVARLKKFYSRFGFVPNSGRKKDFRFRSTMIRMPHGSTTQVQGGGQGDDPSQEQALQDGDT